MAVGCGVTSEKGREAAEATCARAQKRAGGRGGENDPSLTWVSSRLYLRTPPGAGYAVPRGDAWCSRLAEKGRDQRAWDLMSPPFAFILLWLVIVNLFPQRTRRQRPAPTSLLRYPPRTSSSPSPSSLACLNALPPLSPLPPSHLPARTELAVGDRGGLSSSVPPSTDERRPSGDGCWPVRGLPRTPVAVPPRSAGGPAPTIVWRRRASPVTKGGRAAELVAPPCDDDEACERTSASLVESSASKPSPTEGGRGSGGGGGALTGGVATGTRVGEGGAGASGERMRGE